MGMEKNTENGIIIVYDFYDMVFMQMYMAFMQRFFENHDSLITFRK